MKFALKKMILTFVQYFEEANSNLDVIGEREGLVRYFVRCWCREEDVVGDHVAINYHAVNLFRPHGWLQKKKQNLYKNQLREHNKENKEKVRETKLWTFLFVIGYNFSSLIKIICINIILIMSNALIILTKGHLYFSNKIAEFLGT